MLWVPCEKVNRNLCAHDFKLKFYNLASLLSKYADVRKHGKEVLYSSSRYVKYCLGGEKIHTIKLPKGLVGRYQFANFY